MSKRKPLKITVIKENTGYSAYSNVRDNFIATEAETFVELKASILEAINFTFQGNAEYTQDDLSFEFDLKSFFAFYKVINAKALSERIGMNQSLLAQYIRGNKKPSKKQTQRILEGVRQIGKELSEVHILM